MGNNAYKTVDTRLRRQSPGGDGSAGGLYLASFAASTDWLTAVPRTDDPYVRSVTARSWFLRARPPCSQRSRIYSELKN